MNHTVANTNTICPLTVQCTSLQPYKNRLYHSALINVKRYVSLVQSSYLINGQ